MPNRDELDRALLKLRPWLPYLLGQLEIDPRSKVDCNFEFMGVKLKLTIEKE